MKVKRIRIQRTLKRTLIIDQSKKFSEFLLIQSLPIVMIIVSESLSNICDQLLILCDSFFPDVMLFIMFLFAAAFPVPSLKKIPINQYCPKQTFYSK